jgi:hypothetical protein
MYLYKFLTLLAADFMSHVFHISNEWGAHFANVSFIAAGSLLPPFSASGGAGSGLAWAFPPSHAFLKLVSKISGSWQLPDTLWGTERINCFLC